MKNRVFSPQYGGLVLLLTFLSISIFSTAQDTFSGNAFLDHNQNGLLNGLLNGPDYVHPAFQIREGDDERRDNSSLIYLPVELDNFIGGSNDCKIWLSWETSSESGFDLFEIQYSNDGVNFNYAGIVNGSGNPQGGEYFFQENALAFVNYYRLKIVDYDGSFEYSEVLTIEADCGNDIKDIKMHPNPVMAGIDNIHIIPNDPTMSTSLVMTNAEGKDLYRITVDRGAIEMDMTNLAPGMYFISGKNGERRFAEKVVLVNR